MSQHALFTEGFAPLVGTLGYSIPPKGRDFQRQRPTFAGTAYPDSFNVRKRLIRSTWAFTGSGVLADSANQGDAIDIDLRNAGGRPAPTELTAAEFIRAVHPRDIGLFITATAFNPDQYWLGRVNITPSITGTGSLPLLAEGSDDYVSAGGGLIIIVRCNTGRTINGAGVIVAIRSVWQMLSFPSIGPLGALTPATCGVAGVYSMNAPGVSPFDRHPVGGGTANWPPATSVNLTSSHPIINGPYGLVGSSFTMREGEWARFAVTGPGATPIGVIDNLQARTVGGSDLGASMAPIIAVEKGRGRIVIIGCQDMIAKPATGGGFGDPFVPAIYQGGTLLKNSIAWVTQRTPAPPDPRFNP